MFTKSKWFILSLALMLAFVFTACEDLGYETEAITAASEIPTITVQPEGGTFTMGASETLTVTATRADGGTLSYQWYQATDAEYEADGGRKIGSNSATYIISLGKGAWKVYVVVTNTVSEGKPASAKSDLVSVLINDPNDAFYPQINTQPQSTAYVFPLGSVTVDPITVTAASTDGGSLTYQWYKSDAYSNEDGQIITGQTTASYTPPVTAAGTAYYYVVITNTNNAKPGDKTKDIASSPAVIRAVEPNAFITLTDTKKQYVRGFGVMANFWGNAPQDRVSDYEKMFNPKNLGYNMLRIMVPVDDDDSGLTDMRKIMNKVVNNKLTGDKDRSHYYDIVKLVNKYKGYVLASPWSPPAVWKTNNSKVGGGAGKAANLRQTYWQDYADYLAEYCKIMYENGAPVYAVSIQNEPNFEANYDGCEWKDAEMRDFFMTVGRFTEDVKGWGGGKEIPYVLTMNGESANTAAINDAVLNEPKARQYADLFARHFYGSQGVARSSQVQALGKEIWMTEMNVNGGNPAAYVFDSTYNYMWKFFNILDASLRINEENAFIWWYGVRFYSQIGDGEYTTVAGAVLPRGYVMSHYAKFATDTNMINLTLTGKTASGANISVGGASGAFNHTSYDLDSAAVRVTGFLSSDGNSYSVILATPTNTSGGGGTNMGDIQINFPSGFVAKTVTAMRSSQPGGELGETENMGKADTTTVLLKGGTGAFVNLPAGQMLSVKFTK